MMEDILRSFGDQLLSGINRDNESYLDDEALILTALIHKAKGEQGWYESESKCPSHIIFNFDTQTWHYITFLQNHNWAVNEFMIDCPSSRL